MRISDWSSDVCSSDLWFPKISGRQLNEFLGQVHFWVFFIGVNVLFFPMHFLGMSGMPRRIPDYTGAYRSEEHTSELQSLMRISYAVFCLKKKKYISNQSTPSTDYKLITYILTQSTT